MTIMSFSTHNHLTGHHLTLDCNQEKNSPPKCALSGGTHTANYRGCKAYQQLQGKRTNSAAYKSLKDVTRFNHPPLLKAEQSFRLFLTRLTKE